MRGQHFIAIALTIAALGSGNLARAQSTSTTNVDVVSAKARGDQAMEAGAYADALHAYQQAYAARPTPALAYNLGRAYEKLGRYAEALASFEEFSDRASAETKAKVPRLRVLMAEMRAHVAQVTVRSNVPGAVVMVGGTAMGTTPIERPLSLTPGPARIEVRAEGRTPVVFDLSLQEGRSIVLDADFAPPAAPSPPRVTGATVAWHPSREPVSASTSTGIASKWWFWTGVGVVVVGGVAATVAVMSDRSAGRGDIEPRQVAAPLVKF